MEISLLLAKFLGIYLFFMSAALLFHRSSFLKYMSALAESKGCLMIAAIITLLLGSFLVAAHNVWTQDWRVLITILAWLVLIKGIVRLYQPAIGMSLVKGLEKSSTAIITGMIIFAVSIVLLAKGFSIA